RRKADRRWREKIERSVATWWRVLEKRAMNEATPINPQRVFWELSPQLPSDVILTCDSGTSAAWYARDLKARRGMTGSLSGGLATMGNAVPYALAAKLCHPDRPVVALVGDGAMQMLGLNGLVTIADHWRQWRDPRLVVMVLHNGDLNMVTWEQRGTEGDPKFSGSQDLPAFAFADFARMLGLQGRRVERPDQIADAWAEALAADRPFLLEVMTDPNVPPLPPHVSLQQAAHYAKALLHGDPDARQVVMATMREAWDGLVTRNP
ncbi:MAG: thiamine pyrophosphate-requiring protein, partial [Variovorax sp.]